MDPLLHLQYPTYPLASSLPSKPLSFFSALLVPRLAVCFLRLFVSSYSRFVIFDKVLLLICQNSAGACEYGNELSASIKYGEFLY